MGGNRQMRTTTVILALSFLSQFAVIAGPPAATIRVSVTDSTHEAIPGAHVEVCAGDEVLSSAETDAEGTVHLSNLPAGAFTIRVTKDGFDPITKNVLASADAVQVTLTPAARRDSVEVKDTVSPVDQGASSSQEIAPATAKEMPSRPATVADALPLLPGVVRSPAGGLVISGSGEHRSALIVNSADVTDPATGQFGLTVPIDRVETMNVYQTPFLAEYGSFTAGLVSVETRRGGEKWKWELNDPFPDFRIRSYHMRGLMDATPRFNLEGPLIPGKLYFSEGVEYEIRKTEVFELPFPDNQKVQEGFNSFAQLDWVASANQLVTATVHLAPQRMDYVNMNYFNPQPTTPDASTHNYTGTIADKLSIWGGMLDNTLSFTRFDAQVWGQGSQDLVITPLGNTGSYFSQQNRDASRYSWSPIYSFASVNWFGAHNIKAGAYVAESTDRGQVLEHPIDVMNGSNQLLERIAFTGGRPFQMSDADYAVFAQDHWMVTPRLAVDFGVRTESQQLSQSFRVAPRAGIAWTPFSNARTVVRAGFGMFYDRVPLNVYSFSDYPNQVITQYDPVAGLPIAGPFVYENALGVVTKRFPLVFEEPGAGNFSPRSANGSIQIEQPIGQLLKTAGRVHAEPLRRAGNARFCCAEFIDGHGRLSARR